MSKFTKFFFVIVCVFCLNSKAGFCEEITIDTFVENIVKKENIEKPYKNLNYNYQSTKKIPVKIFIKEKIKSELDLYEGKTVDFIVSGDVYYNKRLIIPSGKIIKAKVGTIIKNGMNGIPASIIFDSFEIEGIKQSQISDSVEVFGQDRSLIVFPLKWALTFLPPTGSLTNFIKGGHAKLKPGKILKIYYYPEWT